MKRLLTGAALLLFLSFSTTPMVESRGMAQVQKMEGFDIYMFAEPITPYEEVFNINGFWNWGEVLEERATLDNVVRTMTRNAKKKNRKAYKNGEPKADAIIIYDNDRGVGIKYTEEQ